MEASLPIFPNSEDLKKKARVPSILAFSPFQNQIFGSIDSDLNNLIICPVCHAFFSPLCSFDNENHAWWRCQICENKNHFHRINDEIFNLQKDNSSIECVFKTDDNNPIILMIYLSTNFSSDVEFLQAKIFACSLLRHMDKFSKCIVFIGDDNAQYSALAPPVGPFNKNTMRASLVRFSSVNTLIGLDLSSFFFSLENEATAERAIERLQLSSDSNPAMKVNEMTLTFSRVLNGTPLRTFAILKELNGPTDIFQLMRNYLIRTDFIVTNFNKNTLKMCEDIQGSVHLLSSVNPALQALTLLNQETFFKALLKVKAKICAVKWSKLHHPFSIIKDNEKTLLFAPACTGFGQSFALEIDPLPNQPKLFFQVTAQFITSVGNKTFSILRIFNYTLDCSDDFKTIIDAINWNCVFWYWSRLLPYETHNSITVMIFRAVSSVISEHLAYLKQIYGPEVARQQYDDTNDLIKCVCSFPDFYLADDNQSKRWLGIEIICTLPPNKINFVPKLEQIDNIEFISSPNGINNASNINKLTYETQLGRKVISQIQKKFPFYIPFFSNSPLSFTQIDESRLNKIRELVSSMI